VIWDPIETRLAGVQRVLVVPDGALSLIPFPALPTGDARYLVETGPTIVRIAAERDLVEPRETAPGRGLLAMGGMSYDAEPGASRENTVLAVNATDRGLPPCREFGEVRFEPLPGSGDEAAEVSKTYSESPMRGEPDRLLMAHEATEAAFRSLAPGRRAIHLATHGFFVDPTCSAPSVSTHRGTAGLVTNSGDLPVQAAVDPLRLSGLAFAGANGRADAPDGANDGVLTAGEVAGLDLEGTQIVTLSACESGLGIPVSGEGVLGLERAFHAAGARAVIMSLWAVDDRAARAWMTDFYQALWHDGRDAAEATRAASRAALLRLRAAHGATHPGEWAMFISSGLTR
jgi:CHAT domain-containing protein